MKPDSAHLYFFFLYRDSGPIRCLHLVHLETKHNYSHVFRVKGNSDTMITMDLFCLLIKTVTEAFVV